MTNVLIENVPDKIWKEYKDTVPRSVTLNEDLIKVIKEEVERRKKK